MFDVNVTVRVKSMIFIHGILGSELWCFCSRKQAVKRVWTRYAEKAEQDANGDV